MTRVCARGRVLNHVDKMLELVRAFAGTPPATFLCLCLPTESLLVSNTTSFASLLTHTIFTALPVCRRRGHPRRHLSSPCSYASLFSGLS